MKVIGGLGGTSLYKNFEEPFWTKRLAEHSHGKITGEVSPFDRMGIRGSEVLQLMRLGVIGFGTTSLSLIAAEDPEAAAVDLVGMNPDMPALKEHIAAYRETLAEVFRERYGIELLAVWTYPAQVLFCNKPIAGLRDLKDLRVRTASVVHTDFVEALGGVGVTIPFSGVVDALRRKVVDCAITGTMSGNFIGLHEVTTHIYGMTISWGPYILAANRDAWARLGADVQAFLRRELAVLTDEIWEAADRETQEGFACNTGKSECATGVKGSMTFVPMNPDDELIRKQILGKVILPKWADRCGPECVETWNGTVGAKLGIKASVN